MRVQVDAARCQGHGLCHLVAPQIFSLDPEDGHAVVDAAVLATSSEEDAWRAHQGCPERAIAIET